MLEKVKEDVLELTMTSGNLNLMSASIPQTFTLDLETGKVKGADMSKVDLWWQARTKSNRCLCPYYGSKTRIADLSADIFNQADLHILKNLEYTDAGLEHHDDGVKLRSGLTFAVKTTEGNYAKVRIAKVGYDAKNKNYVVLEWQLFTVTGSVTDDESIIRELHHIDKETREFIRTRQRGQAVELLARTPELISKLPEANIERIQALYNTGRLYWSLQDYDAQAKYLTQAAEEISIRKARAGGQRSSYVNWQLEQSTYQFLGISFRDRGRHKESIPWFEKAVEIGKSANEGDHNAVASKYLAITGDLHFLAIALCANGEKERSDSVFRKIKEACRNFRNPESVHVCNLKNYRC